MAAKKSTKSANKPASPATGKQKTVKKSAKRVVKKKITGTLPEDKYFVLVNGNRLEHYVALADVLEELEDAVVKHHVNEVRHDFANWIRYVFEEENLATELEGVTDKKEMRLIIYKHLVKKHLN